MVKRVFIVHGWQGTPDSGWKPWMKKELEERGFSVSSPAMPDTNFPQMTEWIATLSDLVGEPDSECYFIGHSLGCVTILRYLESIDVNVGGCVLVAGFASDLGYPELENFFPNQFEWEKIKGKSPILAVHSDNDRYVSLHYTDLFQQRLGANILILPAMGHFSGDEGSSEVPEILEAFLKITAN